jgi:signal transduction histidine kinase
LTVIKAFRDLSIHQKLIRMSMLVSTSVLVLACLAFGAYEWATFRGTMVQTLSSHAEIIGINTASALLFNDPAAASETMKTLRLRPSILSAAVYTADGALFAQYVRSDETTLLQMPERISDETESVRFHGDYLLLSRPIRSEGERIGMVYIQSDLSEMRQRLKRYALIVFVVLGVSLLAARSVAAKLQRMVSDPILRLAETARTVSEEKNYSVRAATDNRDELGQLVQTFNEMLSQIQNRDDALQKAHDELEQRVADRTRELEREVVERKRAEEVLKNYSAQLEAANKELEAFSYSVSHDLRAPLRSINGFSQALLEEYRDRMDEQGRDYLKRVKAASKRMADLIDDILELSRVTRSEMRKEPVDLSALANGTASSLKETDPERKAEFVISPNLTVRGDVRLLRVVIENLLGNAWKFTAKRDPARIEVGISEADGKRHYYVRDNGAGFDMAFSGKLFGVFQRLHSEREFQGTGIGLATVQRIIQRHGGRIWAEGEVGKGAVFYFTIG